MTNERNYWCLATLDLKTLIGGEFASPQCARAWRSESGLDRLIVVRVNDDGYGRKLLRPERAGVPDATPAAGHFAT